MSHHHEEIESYNFETYVSVKFTYKKNPARVEEFHGTHEFNEDEEINREIESVKITLSDGEEIDITDRLTKQERKSILNDL